MRSRYFLAITSTNKNIIFALCILFVDMETLNKCIQDSTWLIFTYSLNQSFIHSLSHLLIHSFIHSLNHSFNQLCMPSILDTHVPQLCMDVWLQVWCSCCYHLLVFITVISVASTNVILFPSSRSFFFFVFVNFLLETLLLRNIAINEWYRTQSEMVRQKRRL